VLAALHFSEPSTARLTELNGDGLREALAWCDRQGLTLLLRKILPEATAEPAHKNCLRLQVAEETYRRLAGLPGEFIALKGIAHCDLFGIRPEDRAQYDIDLYFPRDTVETARDALLAQNYESIAGMEKFPTDHLPGLFPRTEWRWRGDYFDPEMPLAIELHFQFWNAQLERLEAPGADEFWTRRVRRTIGGAEIAALCPQDAVAYAALHLLKHVLKAILKFFTSTSWRASSIATPPMKNSGRHGRDCTRLRCAVCRQWHSRLPKRGSDAHLRRRRARRSRNCRGPRAPGSRNSLLRR
jgi:Uncharacterised nucleotidyltransferase